MQDVHQSWEWKDQERAGEERIRKQKDNLQMEIFHKQ